MTVTFVDPPGSQLPSRAESIDFVASSDLAAISVGYGSIVRAEERAYRDGVFLYPYLGSSKVGHSFSLVRDGGWPDDPKIYVDEAGAGTAAALQPLDGDVVAAWAMLADRFSTPMVTPGTDRSGNHNDLSTSNSYYSIPDLIPGESSSQFGSAVSGGFLGSTSSTALHILGELTVTLRVWCPGIGYGDGYLWSQSNFHDGSEAGNCIGSLFFNADGTFSYFVANGPGKTSVVAQYGGTLTRAAWNYLSLRRNAAGTAVTLGLNDVNQTFTGLLPPTGGGTSLPAVGASSWPAERPTCGIADVVVRNVSRSDADLTAWFNVAMGIAA